MGHLTDLEVITLFNSCCSADWDRLEETYDYDLDGNGIIMDEGCARIVEELREILSYCFLGNKDAARDILYTRFWGATPEEAEDFIHKLLNSITPKEMLTSE